MPKNKVFVTKSTGKKDLFSREKFSHALRRASLPEKNIKKVVEALMYQIASSPAIVINERAVFKGNSPSKEELLKEIKKVEE